jgi:hypothetical protein
VHARYLRIRIRDSSPLFALIRGVDGKVTAKLVVPRYEILWFWFELRHQEWSGGLGGKDCNSARRDK